MVKMIVVEFERKHRENVGRRGKIAAAGRGKPTTMQVRLDIGRRTIETWEQVVAAMRESQYTEGSVDDARN
jgi:hypothetical protein